MDAQELRRHFARWATGVTVITTMDREGKPLGKAANSFHVVSLDPPLVAWCVDIGSTRYEEWLAANAYAVHVLGDHQTDLVPRFARSGGEKFEGLSWTPGPLGVPLLEGSHLRVITRVIARHLAGDHTYLVGEVLDMETGDDTNPLLFVEGKVTPFQQPAVLTHER